MYLRTIGRRFTQMIAYFLVMNSKRCTKSFSHVLLTSRVGYHDGKPIESVVYCLNNSEVYNYLAVLKELRELILVIYPYSPIHLLCTDVSSNVSYLCEIV